MVDMNFDSDHRLLKGKLTSKVSQSYGHYIKSRTKPPIILFPQINGESEMDRRLKFLYDALEKEKLVKAKDTSWISKQSFNLLHQKA